MTGKLDMPSREDISRPDRGAVSVSLERLLASEEFAGSPQLAEFLSFVVTAALDGRADRLKGYTIATEALGRPADFDPQTDPIVRVEAIRLRRALASYYDRVGEADPVRISIPRGGYVPVFTVQAPSLAAAEPVAPPAATEAAPASLIPPQSAAEIAASPPVHVAKESAPVRSMKRSRLVWASLALATFAVVAALGALFLAVRGGPPPPTLAVARPQPAATQVASPSPADLRGSATLVVVGLAAGPGAEGVAQRLSQRLVTALARFDEIRVISRGSLPGGDEPTGGAPGSAGYTFEGHVHRRGFEAQAQLRLEDTATGEVVWSRVADLPLDAEIGDAAEESLVRAVATAIAQPYGAITVALLRAQSLQVAGQHPGTVCLTSAFSYWRTFDSAQHRSTRECLEALIAREPDAAEAHALLTYMYLDEHRFAFNLRAGDPPLERALDMARRAVELRPFSARALQALCTAHFVRGDAEIGMRHCEAAQRANPFDSDIVADMGAKLVITGNVARGRELLEVASAFNPGRPAWYDFFIVLGHYLDADLPQARGRLREVGRSDYALLHLVRALVAVDSRDLDGARASLSELLRRQPMFATEPLNALHRHFPNDALVQRLARPLQELGLPVAQP